MVRAGQIGPEPDGDPVYGALLAHDHAARPASCASLGKIEYVADRVELAEAEHAAWKPLADGEHGFGEERVTTLAATQACVRGALVGHSQGEANDTPQAATMVVHSLLCRYLSFIQLAPLGSASGQTHVAHGAQSPICHDDQMTEDEEHEGAILKP